MTLLHTTLLSSANSGELGGKTAFHLQTRLCHTNNFPQIELEVRMAGKILAKEQAQGGLFFDLLTESNLSSLWFTKGQKVWDFLSKAISKCIWCHKGLWTFVLIQLGFPPTKDNRALYTCPFMSLKYI